jgi:UDP-N-acetylglucosamine diphosphorylase/glucosamine-1-phosphate N-acetyltransferase
MQTEGVAVIILAAGLGTRMKSDKAKVLHAIDGKPMILYVADTAVRVAGENIIIVVGHQAETVKETVSEKFGSLFAYQEKQLGTGHAVMCAMPQVADSIEDVVILCGDVPLLSADTVQHLIKKHQSDNNVITILGVELDDPTGYGRLVVDKNNHVTRIVEEADAGPAEKKIQTVNSGIYCVNKKYLELSLKQIRSDNAQNEFYLTDIIEIGNRDNQKIGMVLGQSADEVIGVNSCRDLQAAENLIQNRHGKIS